MIDLLTDVFLQVREFVISVQVSGHGNLIIQFWGFLPKIINTLLNSCIVLEDEFFILEN